MKLIEILVRDLDKHGGWPHGADGVVQDGDGGIWFYQEGLLGEEPEFNPDGEGHFWGSGDITRWVKNGFNLKRAQDCESAVIHRQQYEGALAASKEMLVNKPVAWDGQGLPPVGAAFEYGSHHSPARCIAIGAEYVFAARGEPGTENYEEWLIDKSTSFFPTTTERERFIKSCLEEDVLGSHKLFRATAGALYDSIAEGRLPGVKLEAPDA